MSCYEPQGNEKMFSILHIFSQLITPLGEEHILSGTTAWKHFIYL